MRLISPISRPFAWQADAVSWRPCTIRIFAWIKAIIGLSVSPRGHYTEFRRSEIRARFALYVIIPLSFCVDIMKRAQPLRKTVIAIKRTMSTNEMRKVKERVTLLGACYLLKAAGDECKAKKLLVLIVLLVLLFP